MDGHAIELWQDDRFLATIESDASRAQREAAARLPTNPYSLTRDERIRQRAFELWYLAGSPDGRDKEHWEKATREIDSEAASDTSKE